MRRYEREFKISHRRIRGMRSGDLNDLIAREADAALEGVDTAGAIARVDIETLYTPWDSNYGHYLLTAWIRESAVPRGHCHNCGELIRTMIFKGSDWCSDDCRKALQRRD